MIFENTLKKELRSVAGAVFTALFTITITVMLIRVLGQAAGGKVASADVIKLMGLAMITYLPILLILTGFIAVLMTLSRLYRDSEMVVWFASGQSLFKWILPVLRFGAPLIVCIALLGFWGTPWANKQSAELRERFTKREDVAKVTPGKFQESAAAERIFFVEDLAQDLSTVKHVFVSTLKDNNQSIILSKEGEIETNASGDKFLIMKEGRRYDIPLNAQGDYSVIEFERYGLLAASGSFISQANKNVRNLPFFSLLEERNPVYQGELLWRISLPLMALLLFLLAIPLSFVNPRAGRSVGLIIALLIFVTYSNMMSVFQSWVIQGKYTFGMAWWPMHAVVLLLIALFFWWRFNIHSFWHPRALWNKITIKYKRGNV
jgi:lipopolysaccharide export system permease protein